MYYTIHTGNGRIAEAATAIDTFDPTCKLHPKGSQVTFEVETDLTPDDMGVLIDLYPGAIVDYSLVPMAY